LRAAPEYRQAAVIEVKGRDATATTITVTKNEILYSLNKPHDFILASSNSTGQPIDHYLASRSSASRTLA